MSLQLLSQTIKKNSPKADLKILEKAYKFAEEAHQNQKRKNNQDYFKHPLATAQTLAELKLDLATICAGLLHDIPEETSYSLQEIEKEFGKEIGFLVAGVTKLGKLKYRGLERYAENLRKMFVAIAKDIRIILIKFADRLDNLKTLDALAKEKQFRIAKESLEIYAPIANRLGMGQLRGELEDLSFRYVYPKEYNWVLNLIKSRYEKRKEYIDEIKIEIIKILKEAKIKFLDIHSRVKHFYSLYKKLLSYDKDLDKVYDLVALRIIVSQLEDCYAALGVIHQKWKPLKGRIKDYISQPKPNGYQSLHTTVFGPKGEIFEIQIRTPEMHQKAEFGIASHWYYTESNKRDALSPIKISWIKEIIDWEKEIKDNEEFLEKLKIDLFQNRIFVFTPKGDVLNLPEGATPIDFAYHIHSDLGNQCVGALINDKIASLDTLLKNGDMVKILVDKNRKGPSPNWLNFTKSLNVRAKIRHFLSKTKIT